jgi:TolB-like protein
MMLAAGVLGGLSAGIILSGNTQRIRVAGDAVALRRPEPQPQPQAPRRPQNWGRMRGIGMENAINKAADAFIREIPANLTVALISIHSNDSETSDFIADELQYRLVNAQKFRVIDREAVNLNGARRNPQRNEEAGDMSAISIGRRVGANIVITGEIARTGLAQTLTVKAIDTISGEIVTMARETF